MLEFQNGRFLCYRAFEDGLSCPLGQKRKLKALSLNKVLKLFQLMSPKAMKYDMVLLGGTRLETSPKTGCNWNDGMAESTPSSGSKPIEF